MLRHLFIILLFTVSNLTVFCQQYSSKVITVGEDTFLPYIKGDIVNRISKNDIFFQRVFNILQSHPNVSTPQGYKVEIYSNGTNGILNLYFMPYLLEDGETVVKTSSSIIFFINDILAFLGQPVQSGIEGIYILPKKTGDFFGFPIYENDGVEATVIYKGNEALFLPVSQEEYLSALIKAEETKQKNSGIEISASDHLKDIEKAYQELLKVDKSAAEEFKKEMRSYSNEIDQNNNADILLTSYKNELTRLSSDKRKKQAYYAIYAMEKYGNLSGLLPESDTKYGRALVKPNFRAISENKDNQIKLLVLKWELADNEHSDSPRYYKPQSKIGYSLADDKLLELYNNETIWRSIADQVK